MFSSNSTNWNGVEMRKFNLILSLLLLAPSFSYAAAPSRVYNYVAHNTIDPVENNANENALYTYLQAGVDTYASGSITNDAISAIAAISYSKLNLINSITNADISSSAAIGYSKLNLTGGIVNADISGSAAITDTKLAQITTASKVSGTAITGLASLPAGAGVIPTANLPTLSSAGNQLFTSSGTFTAPTGVTKVYITGIGGGGGGGGATSSNMGGGGGSGAYVINYPFTVTPGNNYTVTINDGGAGGVGASNGSAGGSSVFDSLTLAGGSGGVNGNGTTANGGAGGVGISVFTATTANSASSGGPGISGNPGARADEPNQYGGTGGASLFGTTTGNSGRNTTGNAATANTGAGGGGCWSNSASQTGGAGAKGFLLVQY